MNLNKQNNYSSFWLDNGWDNNSSIFDEEEKKKGVKFGANKSKDKEIGAIGTGSDGKKYVWKGMQWATQDTNAIKRKDVTVTLD